MAKRILSLFLSIVLVLGMVPVQVLAAEAPEESAAVTIPETTAAPETEAPTEPQTVPQTTAAPETEPAETAAVLETEAPATEAPTVPATEAAEETVFTEPEAEETEGFAAAEEAASAAGTCGDGLTWTLDDSGLLTISGEGSMGTYASSALVPWYSSRTQIVTVVIEEGVTDICDYAFNGCSALTAVTIPGSVTTIGKQAFNSCSSLTSVTVPVGVTAIGDSAFSYCSALTSVSLPEGLTTLGQRAFYYDRKLATVEFPSTLTSIGYWAFGCCGMTSVVLPEGVTAIEELAFEACRNLEYVTLPSTLTSIGKSAFNCCEELISINLPEGLTSIGSNAFNYCRSLKSIVIPEGITEIGDYTFRSCYMLASVTIPGTVTRIGESAFAECMDLEGSLVLPEGLTTIGERAFNGCSFSSLTLPSTLTSIGRSAFYGNDFPEAAIPEGITAIPEQLFAYCEKLASVTIPSTVTSIGDGAFTGCDSLTAFTIPAAVTTIGEGAFADCESLTAIHVEEGNAAYASENGVLFNGDMTTLMQYPSGKTDASYTIPDTVTALNAQTFYGNTNLTAVTIPGSVATVGESVFEYCTNLASVTLSEGTAELGYKAFGYTAIESIVFPESLTTLDDCVFFGCDQLAEVSIGTNITNIGTNVFYDCFKLTAIQVAEGNTVYASDDGVLMNKAGTEIIQFPCAKTSYVIPDTVTKLGQSFSGCTALTSITIPGTVTEIESFAFNSCRALTSVTLGEGIPSIGYGMFYGCTALPSITIPASVTAIDNVAFTGCTALTEIHFLGDAPAIESDAFGGTDSWTPKVTATAYYPPDNATWTADVMQNYGGNLVWREEGSVELIASGSCGDALNWALDVNNRLTISGTGEMTTYRSASATPWYSYLSSVTDVVIEEGVTTLSPYAFQRAAQLVCVTLPGTLTVIGEQAFNRCALLERIEIPGSVTTIGRNAFGYCEALTSVALNEGLETIDGSAFSFCTALTAIAIPNSVTGIGDEAFYHCTSLADVTLSPNTTNIGSNAFYGTPWYEAQLNNSDFVVINNVLVEYTGDASDVTVPEGIVSIGSGAFQGREITSVTLPDTVVSIQEGAFRNCTVLREIALPDGIASIGEAAFSGCTGLESITLPGTLQTIESDAFNGCTALEAIVIPASVTTLGTRAFIYCSNLASVTLKEGLQTIGDRAFWGCTGLTSVVIPDTVTAVGEYAFRNCSALTDIQIGSGLRELAYGVFESCTGLEAISIPRTITYIRSNAFWNCDSLTDVAFDRTDSVFGGVEDDDWEDDEDIIPGAGTALEIYSGAFGSCESLVEMYLPGYLTYLHPDTYRSSPNTEFYHVSSVMYANDDYGCVYKIAGMVLTCVPAKLAGDYVIDPGCTAVDADFYGCSLLTSITFPTAVGGIMGEDAFAGCTSLVRVIAGENNTKGYSNDADGALIWSGGNGSYVCFIPADITEYTIPADAVRIYNAAFANARLSAIHVAEGNTSFSSHEGVLFNGDGTVLKLYPSAKADASFVIPEAVEEIADYAFAGADALKELWFTGEPFYISSYIFGGNVSESGGGEGDPAMTFRYPENISYWPDFIYEMGYMFSENIQLKPYLLYTTGTEDAVTVQTGKHLAVRSQKDISGLTAVKVDGKTVDAAHYTVSENGNFILFSESYLETLIAGDHTIVLHFADGDESIGTRDNTMSQAEFREALEQATENGDACVLTGAVVLEEDLNVWPGLWRLKVASGGSITVPKDVTLRMNSELILSGGSVTVESGGTLILNSYAELASGAYLTVAEGGKLIFQAGECYIGDAELQNQGEVILEEYAYLFNGDTIINDGEIRSFGILENGSNGTIENNGTIANGGEFYNDGTLTGNDVVVWEEPEYRVVISGPDRVTSGRTITLTAEIEPENLTGTTIQWTLANQADREYVTLTGSKLTAKTVDRLRTVTVVASARDGSAEAASVEISVLPKASGVFITWENGVSSGDDATMYHDLNDPDAGIITLRASTMPEAAADEVEWTVKSGRGTEKILSADNTLELDPTGLSGSVTVTAKALDGSNKTDKLTIKLVKLAQEIRILNVEEHIRGGTKLSLSTSIASDKSLTSRNVVWSLVDDEEVSSSAYATISAKGKLTTRAVSEATLIKVKASVQENPTVFDIAEIALYPAVDALRILRDGEDVTGSTITADPEDGSLTFEADFLPNGCLEEGTWSTGDRKGAYGTYTETEDGSFVMEPSGKNGTVTITFKADDGSGKSARVKVKFTNLAETITLSETEGQLRSGESLTLKATVTDAAGTVPSSKSVTWTSSDPAAATVSGGKVKAKTVYENTRVTITAAAKDGSGVSASAVILIRPKLDQTLTILCAGENVTGSTHTVNIDSAEPLDISALVYDSVSGSYADAEAALTSSNKRVADMDASGNLTLLKTGSTTITAKSGTQTAKVTIKVVRYADQVEITGKSSWLLSGKTLSLKAAVTAESGTPTTKTVTWASDDESVATVSSSGKVKAAKVYERSDVTITATARDGSGVVGEYTLTVYPAATTVSILSDAYGTLNNRTVSIALAEEELQLTAVVYPWLAGEFGAMQEVQWSSSNKKVADVDDDGCVTLLKKGTVTIKATAADGSKKSVSFKLTVLDPA